MASVRRRADLFLVEHGFAPSRAAAQAAIRAGLVRACGTLVTKPSQMLSDTMVIQFTPAHPYVSRGGVKLSAALDRFGLSPEGLVCLDLGASTGGFTEALLTRGAARVYAVDVGHGQLHAAIATDRRVIALERLNARDLTRAHVPLAPGALVADLSFISLAKALPPALAMAAPGAWAVLLVKPQFEVGPGKVDKSGIVRDVQARDAAVNAVADWLAGEGWTILGQMQSPIEGGDGNVEYLLAARKP